jgi:penicillin amidase
MSSGPAWRRDSNGVFHVRGNDDADLCRGLGRCHATDRAMQMLLMRLLGRGRLSECLDSSDEALAIDTFFRRAGWHVGADEAADQLTPATRQRCRAYCDGINSILSHQSPWEFRLFGYRPEPWTPADSIVLARMTGYLTLAQSQAEIERLLVEMVQAGVGRELLEELFPGLLNDLDEELVAGVTLSDERIVPPAVRWRIGLPRMMASNNWVVAGSRTRSGKPVLANDPHLETNRLPNVWYEIVLEAPGRYVMGATMPGLPAILVGRTHELAWGVTYAFMDAIDSWVEECRTGCCRRGDDQWEPLRQRKEEILRRKKPPVELTVYENEHGILEGDPHRPGRYLATRWSAARSGPLSLDCLLRLWHARGVEEAMAILGKVETAWNWVLADRAGRIGYQMSGLMPVRRAGSRGLVPLAGWMAENDWKGFVDPADLPRAIDPPEGVFVTANHDLNAFGRAAPINMPMGPHRAERIASVLSSARNLAAEDMRRLQLDLFSPHAQQFMTVLRPLLPQTEQGAILREWDLRYDVDSRGAFLFEQFYHALRRDVFGRGMGPDVADHLLRETGIFADFFANFDRVLLAETSTWFGEESREAIYRRVAAEVLNIAPRRWGDVQKLPLTNILFQRRLPRWLGFDRGPIELPGGRATVQQGQIYRSGGRATSFVPSYRMVTDLAEDVIHTTLCGGPSDRRFSRWYCSGLAAWLAGQPKQTAPQAGTTSA